MLLETPSLARFAARLAQHAPLSADEHQLIRSLPVRTRTAGPHEQLYREGEMNEQCFIILDGYAARYKLTANGDRQILAVLMRGDLINYEHLLGSVADHGVEALGRTQLAVVAVGVLDQAVQGAPGIARALSRAMLRDAAIQREWTTNVGRRDALGRLAHLLCELAVLQGEAGLGAPHRFHLPLTQTHLADCTGLTAVHVNRVLRSMRESGLIRHHGRTLQIENWERLRSTADFRPGYLRTGMLPAAQIMPTIAA